MNNCQVELQNMRPEQLDEAVEKFPVGYIPFGAIEYHGRHLPIGLDSTKAHKMLCHIAEQIGGIVVPPLYYGVGGGHVDYPWTWMVDGDALVSIIVTTALGLQRNGVKVIVVCSGHYPNGSLYEGIEKQFKEKGGTAELLTVMEFKAFNEERLQGDHASKFETSSLLALAPETVKMENLQVGETGKNIDVLGLPKPAVEGGWWFEENKEHPWHGIAAAEGNWPVDASADLGWAYIETVKTWLEAKIRAALETSENQPVDDHDEQNSGTHE